MTISRRSQGPPGSSSGSARSRTLKAWAAPPGEPGPWYFRTSANEKPIRAPRSTTSMVSAMARSVSRRRGSPVPGRQALSPAGQRGGGEHHGTGVAEGRARRRAQTDGDGREAREGAGGEQGDRPGRVAVEGRAREDERHPDGEEGHRRHVPRGVEHGLRRPRTAEAAGRQHRRRELAHHEDLAAHTVDGGSEEGEGSGGDQRGIHGRAPI